MIASETITYQEFLDENRNKLLAYYMLAALSTKPDILATPFPPAELSDEQLEALKDRLTGYMPLDSMITDLWDWDIHFEEDLSDDWYFEAVFGSDLSLDSCAEELAEFFVERSRECDMDYDQSPDDPEFESLLQAHAENFILGWRRNVVAKHI